MVAQPHFIDPAQLAGVADLALLARTVVDGFLSGAHRSPHSGASIEFAQYRPYTQDDDARRIDWKLFARADRLHIKQYQEETNMRCTLLLDCSASMDYGSELLTKFDYARMLAACLTMILHRQRDAVGFVAYHREIVTHIPPGADPKRLRQIMIELENLQASGETNTAGALETLGETLPARGMVVLISDLLHPSDEMVRHLKSLRARRHDVLAIQIADPAEQEFPFEQSTTLIDAESGGERFTIPDDVRDEYLANRARHFDEIRRECLAGEIDVDEFSTAEPLDRALRFFLKRRGHALMRSSQRRPRAAAGGRR